MYSAWTTHARATRPPRIEAEQKGGRRGERFCYSFCRRKRLQRDFCESCVRETEIKKELPFLSCIELTVQQGNPQHTEYSLRIIYNLQFEESNFWFDIYSFISLLLFKKITLSVLLALLGTLRSNGATATRTSLKK